MFKTKLKTKLIVAVMLIMGVTAFMSCEKDTEIIKDSASMQTTSNSNDAPFSYKKANASQIKSVNVWKKENLKKINDFCKKNDSFNFQDVELVTNNETGAKSLLIKQNNYNVNDSSSISIGLYLDDNGNISAATFVELIKVDSNFYKINYYDLDYNLLFSINVDKINQTIDVIANNSNNKENDSGQATADCIADAYSNHGWASVALWVTTAICPETAVVVAADCAIHNL